jgi:hypothetical protein
MTGGDMTHDRFVDLIARHGVCLDAWPEADRPTAKTFLATSPEAHAVLDAAVEMEAAFADLRNATAAPPSDALIERVLQDAAEAAPTVDMLDLADFESLGDTTGIGDAARSHSPGIFASVVEAMGGWRPVTAVLASAVIGVSIGLSAPMNVARHIGVDLPVFDRNAEIGDFDDAMDFDGFGF